MCKAKLSGPQKEFLCSLQLTRNSSSTLGPPYGPETAGTRHSPMPTALPPCMNQRSGERALADDCNRREPLPGWRA